MVDIIICILLINFTDSLFTVYKWESWDSIFQRLYQLFPSSRRKCRSFGTTVFLAVQRPLSLFTFGFPDVFLVSGVTLHVTPGSTGHYLTLFYTQYAFEA